MNNRVIHGGRPSSVLQVNSFHYLRGGDSRCMFETSSQLAERGLEVRHFAMSHSDNWSSEDDHYFAPNVDYPALLAKGGLWSAWKALESSVYNGKARSAISELLDNHRPDLAHLHSVMHHLTASVVLELRRRNIPIVWTLHDYKAVCPATSLLRDGAPCEACTGGRFMNAARHRCKRGSFGASLISSVELQMHRWWRVYEDAELLIAPSMFLKDKVLQMGLRPRRIEVLPNFVDTAAYEAAGSDEGYVLYVGRLSREKGLRTFISAAADVPELPVRVAGTGEIDAELRELAVQLGAGHVTFEGFSGGEHLESLYRNARAVVVPSECYENCPMVVLEAYAYGKPVVGTHLGGLVDLVRPGKSGELVPAGDQQAWSRVLRDIAEEPSRWQEMGVSARELALRYYDADPHIDRLLALYAEVA